MTTPYESKCVTPDSIRRNIGRMQASIEALKTEALKGPRTAGDIYDGGNYVVIEFPDVYEAAEFAKNHKRLFEITFETRPTYLDGATSIVFTWK